MFDIHIAGLMMNGVPFVLQQIIHLMLQNVKRNLSRIILCLLLIGVIRNYILRLMNRWDGPGNDVVKVERK